MELTDFIYKTLTSIKQGIHLANKDTGGCFYVNVNGQVINFNVAVEIEKENTKEKGAGLRIHVVEGKMSGNSKTSESNISRIDFTVGVKKTLE